MGSAQIYHLRPIIGHPGDLSQLQSTVGVDTGYVGIVITVVDEIPGVIASRLIIAQEAHGGEGFALIIVAPHNGELSESVSVVFGHESNIQDLRAHGGFGGRLANWPWLAGHLHPGHGARALIGYAPNGLGLSVCRGEALGHLNGVVEVSRPLAPPLIEALESGGLDGEGCGGHWEVVRSIANIGLLGAHVKGH